MSVTPMAFADSLRIGSVEYVSPDKIEVLLDVEAPDSTALNSGSPRPFPRVNGYLLLPAEGGFAVGQVEWITVERSQYPQRKGMRDFGLVDVPYPMRKVSLVPVGILSDDQNSPTGSVRFAFRRGIQAFPTVGDPVLLPTTEQLKAIVESGEHRRVRIGISPLAADAEVMVDPDRLFGRHLAVLGNTGSGKSCSVAGLIRWSLTAAREERVAGNLPRKEPNARFIVLDPNGEYSATFNDLGARRLSVEPGEGAEQLSVPLWFWNTDEWCAFTQATAKTQRPTLINALRALRDGRAGEALTSSRKMRRYLRTVIEIVNMDISAGNPWFGGGKSKGVKERVENWLEGVADSAEFTAPERAAVDALRDATNAFLASHSGRVDWPTYTRAATESLLDALREAHRAFGGVAAEESPLDADIPRPFTGDELLRSVEANAELLGVSEHVETMIMRIRTLLADARLRVVFGDGESSLEAWLASMMAEPDDGATPITVVDLSLVPAEAVHIITAVIARMVLEALQRYRKMHDGAVLPTVLVMEEAHTFVRRYAGDSDSRSAQEICAQAFEKIAREGRKFGLGLVLSSQRPSELSPTVLSQCNTFLLHRLSNHTDQDLVHRLVPDNMRGLLRELPSLPSRNAILLGWASELPVSVEMRLLPRHQQPRSWDPDYWHVWAGRDDEGLTVAREARWAAIADDWQERRADEDLSQL